MNPPCVLDDNDWCNRHGERHVGEVKRLALMEGEPGAGYQRIWDERAGLKRTVRTKRCRHRGRAARDEQGKIKKRDAGY